MEEYGIMEYLIELTVTRRETENLFGMALFANFGSLTLGPYLVIISFSSSLSNYYDAGGRVLPLYHYFIILTH